MYIVKNEVLVLVLVLQGSVLVNITGRTCLQPACVAALKSEIVFTVETRLKATKRFFSRNILISAAEELCHLRVTESRIFRRMRYFRKHHHDVFEPCHQADDDDDYTFCVINVSGCSTYSSVHCPSSVTERFLSQPLVCGTVFHRTSLLPPLSPSSAQLSS